MTAVSKPAWLFSPADQTHLGHSYFMDKLPGVQFDLGNEALNLGIAIYNMRQGEGIRYETLFRDETVGALDTVNGKEYVRMLRRAMDLGGFHQVIFICHAPLVWELADSILSVRLTFLLVLCKRVCSSGWGTVSCRCPGVGSA